MSVLCSAAHSSSTATMLPAQRTPQGADMLSPPSPPTAGRPPLPRSLPQAPAAPVALTEAAVKHPSVLFIVAFSGVMINN